MSRRKLVTLDREDPESRIEKVFTKTCTGHGWEVRKLEWPGHKGAPDRIVMAEEGVTGYGECKRVSKDLEAHQVIERSQLEARGHLVMAIKTEMDVIRFVAAMKRRIAGMKEARRAGILDEWGIG